MERHWCTASFQAGIWPDMLSQTLKVLVIIKNVSRSKFHFHHKKLAEPVKAPRHLETAANTLCKVPRLVDVHSVVDHVCQ